MKKILKHHLPSEFILTNSFETELGTAYIYGNLAIFEAKEGKIISYNTGFSILLKGLKLLGDQPWGYISNRVHSYSLKPIDYKYLNNIPHLKSIGVVCYSELATSNAKLETHFCEKPFRIFNNLPEAAYWVKSFL